MIRFMAFSLCLVSSLVSFQNALFVVFQRKVTLGAVNLEVGIVCVYARVFRVVKVKLACDGLIFLGVTCVAVAAAQHIPKHVATNKRNACGQKNNCQNQRE